MRTDLVAIVDEAVGETADEVFDSVEVVESELPPLEEVDIGLGRRTRRLSSPPPPTTEMAEAEEQIEIPTDAEPAPPKKERKPHEPGITFRDFDVSLGFSV